MESNAMKQVSTSSVRATGRAHICCFSCKVCSTSLCSSKSVTDLWMQTAKRQGKHKLCLLLQTAAKLPKC